MFYITKGFIVDLKDVSAVKIENVTIYFFLRNKSKISVKFSTIKSANNEMEKIVNLFQTLIF